MDFLDDLPVWRMTDVWYVNPEQAVGQPDELLVIQDTITFTMRDITVIIDNLQRMAYVNDDLDVNWNNKHKELTLWQHFVKTVNKRVQQICSDILTHCYRRFRYATSLKLLISAIMNQVAQ